MLGIKKKRVNFASLSESGRLPLHFNIVKSMIQYCYRLENLNTVSIVLHNEGKILVLLFWKVKQDEELKWRYIYS
jgi:hypothetical protein